MPDPTLQAYARDTERRYNIPAGLLSRMIAQESGWAATNADGTPITSPAGAIGIAQFMPETAASMGVNPEDPYSSIDGMGRYMQQMLQRYGGDKSKAVAAYDAGPGAVDQYGGVPPFAETQQYVASIVGGAPAPAVPRYLAGIGDKVRADRAGSSATMPTSIFDTNTAETGGGIAKIGTRPASTGATTATDVAGGSSIADLIARIAQAMAANNLNAYGQIGAVDPAFFNGQDPSTFLPSLSAKAQDANLQTTRMGLLAGLRGPKDAFGYQYLLNGLSAPAGTGSVNPYPSILGQTSPATAAMTAANPNYAADLAKAKAQEAGIKAGTIPNPSVTAPAPGKSVYDIGGKQQPTNPYGDSPSGHWSSVTPEAFAAAEAKAGGGSAPVASNPAAGGGGFTSASAANAALAEQMGGNIPDWLGNFDQGGLLGDAGQPKQAIVGDLPAGDGVAGTEEKLTMLPPKDGKSRAKVEPLSYEKDPVEVAIKMPVRALKMAMGGIFGDADPISTKTYGAQDVAETPTIKQVKGQQDTPTFNGYGAGATSNPGAGLLDLPSAPGYGTLLKMRPSQRDFLSSAYEQGLGLDWRDILANSAAATPVGSRSQPALYGA